MNNFLLLSILGILLLIFASIVRFRRKEEKSGIEKAADIIVFIIGLIAIIYALFKLMQ